MQLDTHVEDAIAAGRAPGQNWAAPNSSWFVQKSMWIHEFFSFLVTKPTCLSLSSTNNTVCLSPGQWYKSKYLYNFSVLWCDVGVQSNEPNLCHVKHSLVSFLWVYGILARGRWYPWGSLARDPSPMWVSHPHYTVWPPWMGVALRHCLCSLLSAGSQSKMTIHAGHPRLPMTSHTCPSSTRTASTPPACTMPNVCAGIPALPPSKPRSHLNSPESTRARADQQTLINRWMITLAHISVKAKGLPD